MRGSAVVEILPKFAVELMLVFGSENCTLLKTFTYKRDALRQCKIGVEPSWSTQEIAGRGSVGASSSGDSSGVASEPCGAERTRLKVRGVRVGFGIDINYRVHEIRAHKIAVTRPGRPRPRSTARESGENVQWKTRPIGEDREEAPAFGQALRSRLPQIGKGKIPSAAKDKALADVEVRARAELVVVVKRYATPAFPES